jgi:hypothetical protein
MEHLPGYFFGGALFVFGPQESKMLNRARVLILALAMLGPLASLREYGQDREPVQSQEQSRLVSARVGDVTRVDVDVWLKRRDESDLQSLRIGNGPEDRCARMSPTH